MTDDATEPVSGRDEDTFWEMIGRLRLCSDEDFSFLELQDFECYSEDSGENDERPVIAANWNLFRPRLLNLESHRAQQAVKLRSWLEQNYPQFLVDEDGEEARFEDVVEEFAHIEWCDNGTECAEDGCRKFVQTQPDHYGWQPPYLSAGYGPVCKECVAEDPEAYLDEYLGGQKVKPKWFDVESMGFVRVDHRMDHGMYRGNTNHDPKAIRKYLIEIERGLIEDYELDFIYELAETQQFQSFYYLYVRVHKEGEVHAEATQRLADTLPSRLDDFSAPGSIAANMARALASIDMTPGPPGTVSYHSIDASGAVTSKDVSHEDFVEGKF